MSATVINFRKALKRRRERAAERADAHYRFTYGIQPDQTLLFLCRCGSSHFHLTIQGPRCTSCGTLALNDEI